MRSSIKDLSHLKLDNILFNSIYPRENDFLLTYSSLVKINVKNNKIKDFKYRKHPVKASGLRIVGKLNKVSKTLSI